MAAHESEAIVLRSFPLGEGDLLVSFLGRTHGRFRGVAKGARRLKSRFGSTLEPFSYIRVWFYERETRELVRIHQTELMESFLEVQRDYPAALALAVASEVSEAVLAEREAAESNFRLMLLTARSIKAGVKPEVALAYFALWTVRLGGWLPHLDRCSRCQAAFGGGAYFSERQGLVCGNCRLFGQRAISSASLELAREMLGQNLWQLSKKSIAEQAVADLKDYMLDILEMHIEKYLQSRKLLKEHLEPPV
jgi:DNA repair protein RecO (recombination protein O)